MVKQSDTHGEIMPLRSPAPVFEMPDAEAITPQPPECSDQERWSRVKKQLRALVGDDIFLSWFASMDLEGVDGEVVRFSVPTRFLKSWIQAHYMDRVLVCWQAEQHSTRRIELVVRSAALRILPAKPKMQPPTETVREGRDVAKEPSARAAHAAPVANAHEALGGSPLDPRLTFETFAVGRANTLAHAAARQVAS